MSRKVQFYLFSAVVMLLLPAGLTLRNAPQPIPDTPPDAECYRVLDSETGEIRSVPVRDYLIGAVGAEVPASYEPEALKAQVIAAHTYAERIRLQNRSAPDPALCGADFSDDSSKYQAFFTLDELRAFCGDAFDTDYAALCDAVDAVGDLLLYYDDEPIAAAFHAISSGQTESAETVWGNALPYLTAVASEADRSAPHYEETVSFPPEAVRQALLQINPQCVLPENPAEWFTDCRTSASGTVLEQHCGDVYISGQSLREAFSLRSACFSVSYDGSAFCFTTRGFGHNVGMSQYGANEMAKKGSSYAEILLHYYPDTVLVHAESQTERKPRNTC